MDDLFEQKYKSSTVFLLPNTKRTQEYLAKKAEEEAKVLKARLERDEEVKRKQEREEKKRQQDEKDRDLKKRKELEEKRRQREVEEAISTMKGKFGVIVTSLGDNKTTYDLTIAGVKLIDAQIRAIVQAVGNNNTLRCLSIQRKKIGDDDGADMLRSLTSNTTLEKLELEGNNFGPKTAREVAYLLRKNRMIKHINLESNNLTNSGKDTEGVVELARALGSGRDRNKDLLYLNLNNTNLDKACSEALEYNMRENKTLIMLDIENNKLMDYKHVRAIQDHLTRNKALYDAERLQEWKERKHLRREEEDMDSYLIKEDYENQQEDFEARYQAKLLKMQEDLQEKISEEEYWREKTIKKLEKEAAARGGKKKKKKKAKK